MLEARNLIAHTTLCSLHLVVAGLMLFAAPAWSYDYDKPVAATKLTILSKPSAGKAQTSLAISDPNVALWGGGDETQIDATVRIRLNDQESTFTLPGGAAWKKNTQKTAKFADKLATGGIKASTITWAKSIKAKGPSLGSPALDVSTAPTGPVYVTYMVNNSGIPNRHCTRFDECEHKALGGSDFKLTCKDGVPDPSCGGACRTVGGVQWCFNPGVCGQACEAVCADLGMTVIASDTVWFEAQDTPAECQAIADAFGLQGGIQFDAWSRGCLEDEVYNNDGYRTPRGPLYCSSYAGCPAEHRTNMDFLGVGCAAAESRRSICPCE